MTMLDASQTPRVCRPPIPRALLVGGLVLAGMLIIASCGDDDDGDQADPAAVLTDYLEVFNAEDAEAVMVFYAEDAVMEDLPPDRASDELATGKSEILVIETGMQVHQGSTGTMEYINMEVSGDTVTFDNIFHNAEGDCFSGTGSVATIENELITLIVWGNPEGGLC
jgi:ketosteroid isomerase-like protein